MPDLLVRSFAPFLFAFEPCFTRPSFSSFWALTCAWILCSGRRSLTRIIQAAQLADLKHYCSFHRFFSQARWNLDALGHCVFQLLLPFCEEVLVGSVLTPLGAPDSTPAHTGALAAGAKVSSRMSDSRGQAGLRQGYPPAPSAGVAAVEFSRCFVSRRTDSMTR